MRALARAALASSALALGCVSLDDQFTCENDTACIRGGEPGVCEPNGFCSFPDDGCPTSHRRYGDHSGALKDTCVAAEATSATGTSTGGGDTGSGAAGGAPSGTGGGGGHGGGVVAEGYPGVVLADHPMLYFRLGESEPPTAKDSGPSGYDGTYVDLAALGVAGAIANDADTAARFDGTSYVDVQVPAAFEFEGRAHFSVEAWVKRDGDGNGIVGKVFHDGTAYRGWFLAYNGDKLIFARGGGSTGVPLPSEGVYVHVVATFDGITNIVYVNGVFAGAEASPSDQVASGQPFRIGQAYAWGDFKGDLDEVAIYDEALEEDQVLAHYNAGIGQ